MLPLRLAREQVGLAPRLDVALGLPVLPLEQSRAQADLVLAELRVDLVDRGRGALQQQRRMPSSGAWITFWCAGQAVAATRYYVMRKRGFKGVRSVCSAAARETPGQNDVAQVRESRTWAQLDRCEVSDQASKRFSHSSLPLKRPASICGLCCGFLLRPTHNESGMKR